MNPRAVNVDVGRNSNALIVELGAGATTYRQHYSALGLDWEQELAQVGIERARLAELGIPPPGQPPAPAQVKDQEEDPIPAKP